MTWEEEYRARLEEEEDLALGHVRSLQDKVEWLEKKLRRQHRKNTFWTIVMIIGFIALLIWAYSGH